MTESNLKKTFLKSQRLEIEKLLKGAQSVLVVGLNYFTLPKRIKSNNLLIGRYAWGNDYHKVIEKRLKEIGHWLTDQRPNSQWKVCVDSKPLLEKAWAEEAGLGWIGKNSNIINSKRGSWEDDTVKIQGMFDIFLNLIDKIKEHARK